MLEFQIFFFFLVGIVLEFLFFFFFLSTALGIPGIFCQTCFGIPSFLWGKKIYPLKGGSDIIWNSPIESKSLEVYGWKEINQLLLPYTFYGKGMKRIYFFLFGSCKPLIDCNITAHTGTIVEVLSYDTCTSEQKSQTSYSHLLHSYLRCEWLLSAKDCHARTKHKSSHNTNFQWFIILFSLYHYNT